MATATSERERVRKAQAKRRAGERAIEIPPPISPERRAAAEADVFLFLATYFRHKFYNPLTENQKAIVRAVLECAETGGDMAIAAPRGDGKTTLTKWVILYCVLTRRLRYPLILAANGMEAKGILDDIKAELEKDESEDGEVLLAEDYPEVCVPIHALEGWASRARLQRNKADGRRTKIVWRDDFIVLPTIKGSHCSGSVIRTRGMDAAIRGINYRGLRPDLVLMDDPETDENAESDPEIKKRERKIERGVAGLRGQSRKMGRLMLCTIQNRKCLAARFTDRTIKPWNGMRFRQVIAWPTAHGTLWQEYVSLIREGKREEATTFYVGHRADMDAGAVLANNTLYEPQEISAIQHCYNFIARNDESAFATEYQNDPPIEDGPEESTITEPLVASRLNEFEQGRVPDNCQSLVAAIDIGKHRCYWEVQAWRAGAIGFIVDYGWADVMGTSIEDDDKVAIEAAVLRTLFVIRDRWISEPYIKADGEIVPIDLCLVDSGDGKTQEAVYEFVRRSGKPFVASKGFGDGRGSSPFHLGKHSQERRIGNQWFQALQAEARLWLFGFNADHWKHYVHDRFQTETYDDDGNYRAGSLSLFKPVDRFQHAKFSRSIVSEKFREEFEKGKGWKRQWVKVSKENHWFDTTVMCAVAADMRGIKLIGEPKAKRRYVPLDKMGKK